MRKLILFFALIVLFSKNSKAEDYPTLSIGSKAPDFYLKSTNGMYYSLNSWKSAKLLVLIFSCNHCLTAQAYEDRIIDFQRRHKADGVQVVVISPNADKAVRFDELGFLDLNDSFEEMKIRVIVFDDNHTRRDGLEMMINLTPTMTCIGAYPDCREVVNIVKVNKPDVVLMDIDMPYVNGLEGVILLREYFPELRIIMQTVFEEDDKIFACIRAGADGYILKKTPPHELIKGIIDVTEGGAPMTPSVARQVLRLCTEPKKQKNNEAA